ncbi:PRC-barrel domain-containing protein [Leptolyngbya sp. AN03gr2]|uniref:PRC-barrel domain-containing protein n=1 Tax=unclassified Leptolyngbya TaxID=2650499 RepID=UPI003D32446E
MLHKIGEYYPNYRTPFGSSTIKTVEVYAGNHEKVGSVKDILVDGETGRFRYLIVETGISYVGKQVVLPVDLAQLDYENQCIRVPHLSKQQIEDLPDFAGELGTNINYEERISQTYGSLTSNSTIASKRRSASYGATDSFHDYENRLLAQRNSGKPT